jgi:hypothetical protein
MGQDLAWFELHDGLGVDAAALAHNRSHEFGGDLFWAFDTDGLNKLSLAIGGRAPASLDFRPG